MKETDRYDDIIRLEHPQSKKHPPMPEEDRAAQFSPFAALKGYEEEIEEAARFVDGRLELDEERVSAINGALVQLKAREREKPFARVKFFKPDARKKGGEFVTVSAPVYRVDERRQLLVTAEASIAFDDIVEIELTSKN